MSRIYGRILKNGRPSSGRISTSWNSKQAFGSDGSYNLDIGSSPNQEITVFVDGSTFSKIYVGKDDVKLDINL